MNDYSEIHWAYDRFIEAVNLDRELYEDEFFDYLDKFISEMQLHTLPLLSCFSTDGDVLSQWRAYAEDGAGVAVGFDSAAMKGLAVRCAPVVYEHSKQVGYFRDFMSAAFPMWKVSTSKADKAALKNFVFMTAFDMCLMKNPAFSEEKEVRILRAVTVTRDENGWHLTDTGGSGTDKVSRRKQPIKFRARGGGIVAHLDLPISGAGNRFIKEVVLGPRSRNNGIEVSMALTANGFVQSAIRKSEATYR
jgi:hypothetical protein